jgi:hypothetical protein
MGWRIRIPADGSIDFVEVGEAGGPDDIRLQDEANARLIAAAPALLAALESAKAAMLAVYDPGFADTLGEMQDAIKAARA